MRHGFLLEEDDDDEEDEEKEVEEEEHNKEVRAGFHALVSHHEEEEIFELGYGACLYYVWQVFCSTPFGEILPKTLGGKIFT